MSLASQKPSPSLVSIRNNLAHVYRFGGICTSLKFNPSNITNEESKKLTNLIINSLNEELWEFGIDIITTNYNNGGVGFMLVTTTENKDKIKNLLENLQITKSLRNEYVVMVNDILNLSKTPRFVSEEFSSVSYLMTIYDSYKINTQNQFALSLNEEANTSCEVQISERSIADIQGQLSKLGFGGGDNSWLSLLSEFTASVADKGKKVAVPLALIAALVWLIQFLYKSYSGNKGVQDTFEVTQEEVTTPEEAVDDANNYGPAEPNEPAGPAEPFSPEPAAPAEPAAPSDPIAFTLALDRTTNSTNNNRLSSLLKTLEDSDVKENKVGQIESKIIALLNETTSSH